MQQVQDELRATRVIFRPFSQLGEKCSDYAQNHRTVNPITFGVCAEATRLGRLLHLICVRERNLRSTFYSNEVVKTSGHRALQAPYYRRFANRDWRNIAITLIVDSQEPSPKAQRQGR